VISVHRQSEFCANDDQQQPMRCSQRKGVDQIEKINKLEWENSFAEARLIYPMIADKMKNRRGNLNHWREITR
jgi:hypothetical protein